jgi:hypothetical protein
MPYTLVRTLATFPEWDGTRHAVLARDDSRTKPLAVLYTRHPNANLNNRRTVDILARDVTTEEQAERIAADRVIDSIINAAHLAQTEALASYAQEVTGYASALPAPDADTDPDAGRSTRTSLRWRGSTTRRRSDRTAAPTPSRSDSDRLVSGRGRAGWRERPAVPRIGARPRAGSRSRRHTTVRMKVKGAGRVAAPVRVRWRARAIDEAKRRRQGLDFHPSGGARRRG